VCVCVYFACSFFFLFPCHYFKYIFYLVSRSICCFFSLHLLIYILFFETNGVLSWARLGGMWAVLHAAATAIVGAPAAAATVVRATPPVTDSSTTASSSSVRHRAPPSTLHTSSSPPLGDTNSFFDSSTHKTDASLLGLSVNSESKLLKSDHHDRGQVHATNPFLQENVGGSSSNLNITSPSVRDSFPTSRFGSSASSRASPCTNRTSIGGLKIVAFTPLGDTGYGAWWVARADTFYTRYRHQRVIDAGVD
jgi:hypothetical protein